MSAEEYYKIPTRSTEVKLRQPPTRVEALATEPEEEEFDEEGYERSIRKPTKNRSILITVIVVCVVIVIAIIIAFLLYRQSQAAATAAAAVVSGPSTVAVLGASCATNP